MRHPSYYDKSKSFLHNYAVNANQYLWVTGRTADAAWVEIDNRYWLPMTNAEFLVDVAQIPIE
jgi:hypothetical protein